MNKPLFVVGTAVLSSAILLFFIAPTMASTGGMGDFYLPRDAVNDNNDIIPPPAVVQHSGQAPNTEIEEAQNLINVAEVTFMICIDVENRPYSTVKSYQQQECDHNVLFLKGICEASNNTTYDWCFNTDMVRYLNAQDINNAPRPPDVWCNMFIDKCIAKHEALKESVIESGEPLGLSNSPATNDFVDSIDEIIQELEDKKDAAAQVDNDNDNDNDD